VGKALGETISQLSIVGDLLKAKNPGSDFLSYEMNIDIYMFGVTVEDEISCNINGTVLRATFFSALLDPFHLKNHIL